jgi:PEP-CTERM motif-containing protein
MRLLNLALLATTFLAVSPIYATTTYWGGFEDTINGDYDYNDLVFSISGSNLTLDTTTGVWFNKSAAGTLNKNFGGSGTPFWNNASSDGSGGKNIGWCIYGGGACNGGIGMAPSDQYLATKTGGSVNDVYFSVNGQVSEQVTLDISADSNTLGWEAVGSTTVNLFAAGQQSQTFDPGGNFVLVGNVEPGNKDFYSNTAASDHDSHFAFFGASPVPEPSSMGLLGLALVSGGWAFRKKLKA